VIAIEKIQEALRREGLDGWLFFDHHRRDPLAYRILGLPENLVATRRWYYFVPATGTPRKVVHYIEAGALDSLPGDKESYSSWADQQQKLQNLFHGRPQIAMQYSPRCAIPYVSLVDGGTLELIRDAGARIVSSAKLVQEFEARWTEQQFQQHISAGKLVDQVRREAFEFVSHHLATQSPTTEYEVQQFILKGFQTSRLFIDHGPIVAVNANASDPHYEPTGERHSQIKRGDVVLIDLWAKLKELGATYYDVTWTGYCGESIPSRIQNVFEIVKEARERACHFVIESVKAGETIAGYQVDDQARDLITARGFGESFPHRTGHSIGTEVHGTGANMDNLESHDDRPVIARTCFSVEPGIYLREFGIRSEVNVYVGEGFATVTGEQQEVLVQI
jgi:Xaa-Pro aminopeptidase